MDSTDILESTSWSRHQSTFFYSVFVFWNFCGLVTALSVIAGTWLTQTIWRNRKAARRKTSNLHAEGIEQDGWNGLNSEEEATLQDSQRTFYVPFVNKSSEARLKIL